MLAPSLNLIISQRLVRKICPTCATSRDANYSEKAEIEESIKKITDANPTVKIDFNGKVLQAV